MSAARAIALPPDAGPLIALAYANAPDVSFEPGWQVMIVDRVLHELTRKLTPTSQTIAQWAAQERRRRVHTQTLAAHLSASQSRSADLWEQAIRNASRPAVFAINVSARCINPGATLAVPPNEGANYTTTVNRHRLRHKAEPQAFHPYKSGSAAARLE